MDLSAAHKEELLEAINLIEAVLDNDGFPDRTFRAYLSLASSHCLAVRKYGSGRIVESKTVKTNLSQGV